MPLTLELRPHEKLFINGAVIANGAERAHISLLNDANVLREKDILTEPQANTPCKRVYLALQLMYMDPANQPRYQAQYQEFCAEVRQAAPSTGERLDAIDSDLAAGRLYQALRTARKLIDYEQDLLQHAQQPT